MGHGCPIPDDPFSTKKKVFFFNFRRLDSLKRAESLMTKITDVYPKALLLCMISANFSADRFFYEVQMLQRRVHLYTNTCDSSTKNKALYKSSEDYMIRRLISPGLSRIRPSKPYSTIHCIDRRRDWEKKILKISAKKFRTPSINHFRCALFPNGGLRFIIIDTVTWTSFLERNWTFVFKKTCVFKIKSLLFSRCFWVTSKKLSVLKQTNP